MRKLNELTFDNTYARLPDAFYSKVSPTPLPDPYLVSFNPAAAELIDLDPREAERPEFVEYFGGRRALPGAEPLAMLYAGHQFGSYVPQLGDGRAILLGEVRNTRGAKWDLHLKGAGPTAYSRGFDGRAVLRSTVREYLCGEAMHALGIPSSRALCIVGGDEPVRRETVETAATLVRMSESHVRFGTFEVFYYRREPERVRELADYVIANHFPELAADEDKYRQFLLEAVRRTARLIAKWQAVGFAHGVMNTDNMSVVGLTIDYGPFGFLDDYHAGFVCNHSDYSGRYAFDQQPAVGLWNLSRLAQALVNLITVEEATEALGAYQPTFSAHYGELMRAKLGLTTEAESDAELLLGLLGLLEANGVDYTNFFRRLGNFTTTTTTTRDGGGGARQYDELRDMFVEPAAFDAWAVRYRARLLVEASTDAARKTRMDGVNPKYVLRNYLAQNAISAAVERRDYTEIERLREVLGAPFAEQPGREPYAEPPPEWGKRLAVSCSS